MQVVASQAAADDLDTLFANQRAAFRAQPFPSLSERRGWLDRLAKAVVARADDLCEAAISDFGHRSRHETMAAEVFTTVNSIKHTRKHLKAWMKPERRPISVLFQPASAAVYAQPLGVVGIIGPWNYPAYLNFCPIATALAAGNRVMVKPSELTPAVSALLEEMLTELFPSDLVAVCQGGVEVGQRFSALPFDHLFYTGSTHVGRLVMQAAAKNLTPVTLELGGKSPVIVHRGFDLARAAERVAVGKMMNAGQTCIAPDYVLVHRSEVDGFVQALRSAVQRLYPTLASNPDYTSVINERHRKRLEANLSDAAEKGAEIVEINPANESFEGVANKMPLRVVLGGTDEMQVMQDEIFGPILPVVPYDTLGDALDHVNDRPRPLALYYFDTDERRVETVLTRTTSGGVCVNETMLHVAQDDLPFGGVGPSGIGRYHAKEGFDTFSNRKAVFRQRRLNGLWLFNPPYGRRMERILDLLLGR